MKVIITGGTGFIGRNLTQKLTNSGHEVTILTRSIKKGASLPERASFLEGNPIESGPWQEKIAHHSVIINLAGASIFQRWTKKTKREILESRIKVTNNIVAALAEGKGKETHFFSTSAVGYYGFHGDELLDEDELPGDDFLAQVCSEWERAAKKAQEFAARVVICRFGIVLGKHGGALRKMIKPFKFYLGSSFGNGKQWFSWIHEEDLANTFLFLLENKSIEGPINCTSPSPIRNKEMTKLLGEVLHKPIIMPLIPGFMLKLILGEFSTVLLKGQRVHPKKLLDSGFKFQFPSMQQALQNLIRR